MGFTYNILYWGCKIGLVKAVTVCGPWVTKQYGSKKNVIMKCFLLSKRCTNSLLLAASSIESLVPSFGTYNTVFPCILCRVSVKLAINLCSWAEKSFLMPYLWLRVIILLPWVKNINYFSAIRYNNIDLWYQGLVENFIKVTSSLFNILKDKFTPEGTFF